MFDEMGIGPAAPAGGDEMWPRAIALVQENKRASISMLQRRLRIGYSRAARLIDEMEKRGIIGPEQEGSRTREVLQAGLVEGDEEPDDLPPL
jgi:S-DNA-T family DNA segregation ATPase FtsK/SpoIIIE